MDELEHKEEQKHQKEQYDGADAQKELKNKKKFCEPNSAKFKFRKFVNSTVAKSSLGRKAILHFVGEAGSSVIDSTQKMVEVTHSKKAGRELVTDLIKLALKGKLLHDTRQITQKDVFHLMDPVNYLVIQLYNMLCGTTPTDAAGLSQCGARLKVDMCLMLAPHMTKKNLDKLDNILDIVSGEDFLVRLFTDESLKQHSEDITTHLGTILGPLLAQREDENQCTYASCKQKVLNAVLKADTSVRILTYCPNHHRKVAMKLAETPHIAHFMVEDTECEAFETFMTQHLPPNYLPLYRGTTNFQRCAKHVRPHFMKAILNKYFNPEASHPVTTAPAELVEEMRHHVTTNSVSPTSCDKLQEHVRNGINDVFLNQFVKSDEFKGYLASLQLPQFLEDSFREVDIRKTQALLDDLHIGDDEEKDRSASTTSNESTVSTTAPSSTLSCPPTTSSTPAASKSKFKFGFTRKTSAPDLERR